MTSRPRSGRTPIPRSGWRRSIRTLLTAAVVCTPALAVTGGPAPAHAVDPDPTVTLLAPERTVTYTYGNNNRVYSDLGVELEISGGPLEIWTQRDAAYESGLVVTIKKPSGDVVLPEGITDTMGRLDDFFTLTFTSLADPGAEPKVTSKYACIGADTQRVSPDGPARSPYPQGCRYHRYSLGAVNGVPQGWSTSGLGYRHTIKPGRYDVEIAISDVYADALGISAEDRVLTQRLVVKKDDGGGCRGCRPAHGGDDDPSVDLEPAESEPTGNGIASLEDLPPGTPTPDLRAVPAFGIELNSKGTLLRFSANVWNGGNSPLVVDGFRRTGEDIMDAYQYFFDANGNQVAYDAVGTMEWDPDPTHQHWHFTDFARYELLDEDMNPVTPSGKEAFCLLPTDAIDLTVEGADWDTERGDLNTSCGGYEDRSIREVLQSGWGDTYSQYRAGQAFELAGVADGIYYVRVEVNPEGNLIESDTSNNDSLRKVKLRTTVSGERRVKVYPVGVIVEN